MNEFNNTFKKLINELSQPTNIIDNKKLEFIIHKSDWLNIKEQLRVLTKNFIEHNHKDNDDLIIVVIPINNITQGNVTQIKKLFERFK